MRALSSRDPSPARFPGPSPVRVRRRVIVGCEPRDDAWRLRLADRRSSFSPSTRLPDEEGGEEEGGEQREEEQEQEDDGCAVAFA